MTDTLREFADKLGLAAIGVAPATDEVTRVYDWARSVVVAAVSYLPPDEPEHDDKPHGLVARVARSSDYHDVVRRKLAVLAEALKSEHAGRMRVEVCVDTNPLPERKLAVLGGIGWRGKNGCVFVEGCGSYAALGEIVADLELPPSNPDTRDECGQCRQCLDACPVQAITGPFEIDMRRCLSALTQTRGVIPLEFRAALGNRIYGCDVCQEVCPQNAGAKPSCPEFARKAYPGAYPELLPLARLTSGEFSRKVKGSSIGWIGRTKLRRNAATALGNMKCESAVPALTAMLNEQSTVLRIHASWSLGEIGSDAARAALRERLKTETERTVTEEIEWALSKLGVAVSGASDDKDGG